MIVPLAAALAAIALVLLGQWRMLPTADVSWLLHAAGRVLDGARIGRDVVDVNFPLVILDKLPAVLAARVLGADPWHAWLVGLVLLVIVALALAARVPGSRFASPLHGALAALVLLAAPRGDFGQREHVAVIAVLPFLVVAGARLARRRVPSGVAIAAGLLAVPGLALKPFFVLVPIAVALVEWRRGSAVREMTSWPEHWLVAGGVPLLWLVQLLAAPDWLGSARWYWPLYSRYGGGVAVQLGVLASGVLSLAIAAMLAARWRARGHLDAEGEALMAGMLGFFACIVIQGRSLTYHFVPVMVLVALLAVLWLTRSEAGRPLPTALVAGLLAAIVVRAPWDGARLLAGVHVSRAQEDPFLPGLQRAIGPGPGGRSVAVLSTNPASVYPLVPSLAADSPFRQISLWPIIGLNAEAVYGDSVVTCTTASTWSAVERHWRDEIAEDLARHPPDVFVVLEPDLGVWGWGDARRIDYLACLRRDSRLVGMLDAFSEAARVGPYRVLRRRVARAG